MLTDEQRANRRGYIGGSDAGVILGVNQYKSAVDLYLEKTGNKAEEDISDKPAVKAGNYLEPIVRKWFADETGLEVIEEPEMLISPDYYWMAANIDGRIVGKNEILEIKTARSRKGWGEGDDVETIPESYLAQVAHYCLVTGADICHIAVLFGGVDFRTYIYRRNARIEAVLIREQKKFWEEHVLKGIAPEPKSSNDVLAIIGELSTDSIAIAEPNIAEALEVYNAAHQAMNDAIKIKSEAKDLACAYMKENTTLVDAWGNRIATWKWAEGRKTFDKERFMKEMPEVYAKYERKEEGIRQFRPIHDYK